MMMIEPILIAVIAVVVAVVAVLICLEVQFDRDRREVRDAVEAYRRASLDAKWGPPTHLEVTSASDTKRRFIRIK